MALSLCQVELRDCLQELSESGSGASVLPATIVFDHPTVNAIGRFLDGLALEQHVDVVPDAVNAGGGVECDVCLAACAPRALLPGNGSSEEHVWCMSLSGADVTSGVPPSRWDGQAVMNALATNRCGTQMLPYATTPIL